MNIPARKNGKTTEKQLNIGDINKTMKMKNTPKKTKWKKNKKHTVLQSGECRSKEKPGNTSKESHSSKRRIKLGQLFILGSNIDV